MTLTLNDLTLADHTEVYHITATTEMHDGERLYVSRVEEFPNIAAFEDTLHESVNLVVDAIDTLKQLQLEEQIAESRDIDWVEVYRLHHTTDTSRNVFPADLLARHIGAE